LLTWAFCAQHSARIQGVGTAYVEDIEAELAMRHTTPAERLRYMQAVLERPITEQGVGRLASGEDSCVLSRNRADVTLLTRAF